MRTRKDLCYTLPVFLGVSNHAVATDVPVSAFFFIRHEDVRRAVRLLMACFFCASICPQTSSAAEKKTRSEYAQAVHPQRNACKTHGSNIKRPTSQEHETLLVSHGSTQGSGLRFERLGFSSSVRGLRSRRRVSYPSSPSDKKEPHKNLSLGFSRQ